MSHLIDRTGQRFGKLTVMGRAPSNDSGKTLWMCRCECGAVVTKQATHLVEGLVRTCGKGLCRYPRGSRNPNFRGHGDLSAAAFYRIASHAQGKSREFGITIEDAWSKYAQQRGVCALTGVPLSFSPKQTASLDRVDSNRGYVIGNIQWVHKDINRLKSNFTQDEFVRLCRMVAKYADHS